MRMKSVPPPEKIQQENPLRSSRPEQLQHGLVHHRRIRSPEAGMPGRRQPAPAQGVKFIGGDAGVSELDQLNQGRHAARVQRFQAGGMTQLGRPVQREHELRVHGLLGPQRAVVVEDRDPVRLRDEVRRVRMAHGGDELHDGLLRGSLTPARQWIRGHGGQPRMVARETVHPVGVTCPPRGTPPPPGTPAIPADTRYPTTGSAAPSRGGMLKSPRSNSPGVTPQV